MRRVRYCVAMSLDGYIAGPSGEFDWIPTDLDFDFDAFYATIDAVLMGRKTFEIAGGKAMKGTTNYVFSRTLAEEDRQGATLVREEAGAFVAELKRREGKDIWLFGGGKLLASLLDSGVVDTVQLGIVPVLLGGGIPVVATLSRHIPLKLVKTEALPNGMISVHYKVGAPDVHAAVSKKRTRRTQGDQRTAKRKGPR